MKQLDDILEYELIDITFELPYKLAEEDSACFFSEDGPKSDGKPAQEIEYDADGVPMGGTKAEIKMREKVIKDLYAKWIANNPEKKIWNDNLGSYIHVKYLSINETYNKAARTYDSTKAIFQLTNILKNAEKVSEQPAKTTNKNQKSFSKILVMRYEYIKLTVGYQKATNENVQYCISVPQK